VAYGFPLPLFKNDHKMFKKNIFLVSQWLKWLFQVSYGVGVARGVIRRQLLSHFPYSRSCRRNPPELVKLANCPKQGDMSRLPASNMAI
jgi:hypothetical protein